jgi:hypothetical protein
MMDKILNRKQFILDFFLNWLFLVHVEVNKRWTDIKPSTSPHWVNNISIVGQKTCVAVF